MDLRPRPSWDKKYAEMLIRFRLPILVLLILLWWFFAADWQDMLSVVLGQAERNAQILEGLWNAQWGNGWDWGRFGFVVILFLVLRIRLAGIIQGGWHTLLALAMVGGGCWLLEGSALYLPAILSAVLVALVTLFFFARRVRLIAALAVLLSLFFLAGWIPGVAAARGLGWQITMALALADLLRATRIIRDELAQGRIATGAIIQAVQDISAGVLVSFSVLISADILLYALDMPTLHAGSFWASVAADLGYVITVLVLAPILFSLSPLNRSRSIVRRLSL